MKTSYFFYAALLSLGALLVYFYMPYSALRSSFQRTQKHIEDESPTITKTFDDASIADLPMPVISYLKRAGYYGQPQMRGMTAFFKGADFIMDTSRPKLRIDYRQCNYAFEPVRIAFIDSKFFGLPFQGFDNFWRDQRFMKGRLAKLITVFDIDNDAYVKGTLATILAECLVVPSVALQDYISWQAIDDYHARATLSWQGHQVSGVFTFNEHYDMIEYRTADRPYVDQQGNAKSIEWSAVAGGYQRVGHFILPTTMKSIWHDPAGDIIYFDSDNVDITYIY